MVFAALLEYGSIFVIKFWKGIPLEQINHIPIRTNRIGSKSNNQDQAKIKIKGNAFVLREYNNETKDTNSKLSTNVCANEKTLSLLLNLDSFSLIAFPAIFCFFVIVYLLVYLLD